ncbi:MAG TPA: hypothetical protein PKC28_08540 [Bdellovibrionales bacterium]|nr:hypothetical protein [Bdellovibrionales bacterium]
MTDSNAEILRPIFYAISAYLVTAIGTWAWNLALNDPELSAMQVYLAFYVTFFLSVAGILFWRWLAMRVAFVGVIVFFGLTVRQWLWDVDFMVWVGWAVVMACPFPLRPPRRETALGLRALLFTSLAFIAWTSFTEGRGLQTVALILGPALLIAGWGPHRQRAD